MTIEKFDIRNRWTDAVMFTAEISVTPDMLPSVKLGLAVKWAAKEKKSLSYANLIGANLSYANLSDANLSDANLSGANLSYANLSCANLSYADLSYANLSYANLSDANLSCANLSYANLGCANLIGANLSYANLSDANLSDANLSYANLNCAKYAAYAIAQTRILPDEGDVIGWKKCQGGVIVKLRVPEDAPRSHAFGRTCRARFADVLEVIGADEAASQHDSKFIYRAGERVEALNWCDDWTQECAGGVHFFITRLEAENY